jgi:hypothetical protein
MSTAVVTHGPVPTVILVKCSLPHVIAQNLVTKASKPNGCDTGRSGPLTARLRSKAAVPLSASYGRGQGTPPNPQIRRFALTPGCPFTRII